MSTTALPKQLIPIIGGRSLLSEAMGRLDGLFEPAHRFICTGESLRGPIRQSIPQIADEQILGEPEGRDTLAAVGLPAAVLSRRDPQATIATFTADHVIEPVDAFQRAVQTGLSIAETLPDTLVTFGIRPTRPATEYGYVRLGDPLDGFKSACHTAQFKEKPDAQAAAHYLESGQYLWNSGMFVWRAVTLLDCIRRFKPAVHDGLMEIAAAWDTPRRAQTLATLYPRLEKISIDYAVMERAVPDPHVHVATVAMEARWVDIGSWPAYAQTIDSDSAGNRVTGGRFVQLQAANNIVVSHDPHHLVAAIGVEDLIIVHTAQATLVCRRQDAEQIKALHARIAQELGERYL